MNFPERLKELRAMHELTQEEFASKSGLSRSAVGMYESGKREPSFEILEKIADFFNVDMNYLLGKSDTTTRLFNEHVSPISNLVPIERKQIPVLGTIAAGKPIYADEHLETYVPCDSSMHVDFALKVKGDSMINAGINDGDIVFIKKQPTVENGQIAAVLIDDEATLKHVYYTGDSCTLIADNPKYPPMVFNSSNCDTFQILGLAIATLSMITY